MTPYICVDCKLDHPKGHSSSFISAQNLYNDQFTSLYAKNLQTRFSAEHIKSIHQETVIILNKMEEEMLKSIQELKKNAEEYFADLSETIERVRRTYVDYTELSLLSSKSEVEAEQLKLLVENYKILKQDIKIFDLNLDTVPGNLQRDAETAINKFRSDVLSKLNASLDLQPIDFFKLKIKTSYSIPCSEGVLYEACAFIPKWKLLAVGFRKNQQGSLGLYNLESHELVSTAYNVHTKWINHVIWVEKHNYIVTCSNDMKIKVFVASNQGKVIQPITTFRGHTNLVRCIRYLETEDLLVSAGDDPDIKVWDLKTLKRFANISTNANTNMDGSIAYIPKEKLIGVGFRSGTVRFYHLYKKNCVLEFKTGFENFYTYGLQYLPKRKLILGRVKERVIKVWKYDDEKKKVEPYKTIKAKGDYPDCIVANEDESQLLFTSRDQFLEMYDFATEKTAMYNLGTHIKKTNALVFLDSLGKVSVCDYTSGKVVILH
jgi:WD40 repeat protein